MRAKGKLPQNGTENYNYYTFMQEMHDTVTAKSFITDFTYIYGRAIRFLVPP